MIRVKICGITQREDALGALEAGANALGFVFAKSPRQVSAAKASEIIHELTPFVTAVGVFVNEKPKNILDIHKKVGIGVAQLHGDENPKDISSLQKEGLFVIKSFRVGDSLDVTTLRNCTADAILLDTAVKGVYGGTGKSFDWSLLKKLQLSRPVIISGGLDPKNVDTLLKTYSPYAVDVSSGVESAPGKKDLKKIQEFISHVKKF